MNYRDMLQQLELKKMQFRTFRYIVYIEGVNFLPHHLRQWDNLTRVSCHITSDIAGCAIDANDQAESLLYIENILEKYDHNEIEEVTRRLRL